LPNQEIDMAFYNNSSLIGVDFNSVSTTQLFSLGTTAEGSDGTIFQYTQASTSVSAFAVVAINAAGTCAMASVLDAVQNLKLGVSQIAIAANEYGWVPIHGTGGATGTLKVLCSATMSGGCSLYVGSRTGVVSIQASSSATVRGIVVYAASGSDHSTTTSLACVLTWPKSNYLGS
jgi:hypothetical protein